MSNKRFNPSVRLIGLLAGLVVAVLGAGVAAATLGIDEPDTTPAPLTVDMLADTDVAGFDVAEPLGPAEPTDDTAALDHGEPAVPSVPDDEVDEDGEDVGGEPGVAGPGEHGSDWTDGADPTSTGSVDLDPATPEIDPCDLIADPEQDFVVPTVVELASGEFAGQLQIMNCSSGVLDVCLLYTSPSPRDRYISRMPSSA